MFCLFGGKALQSKQIPIPFSFNYTVPYLFSVQGKHQASVPAFLSSDDPYLTVQLVYLVIKQSSIFNACLDYSQNLAILLWIVKCILKYIAFSFFLFFFKYILPPSKKVSSTNVDSVIAG